jgi:hypothetical protein
MPYALTELPLIQISSLQIYSCWLKKRLVDKIAKHPVVYILFAFR